MKAGRPKVENPRSMTVSETRVTWEEYRMIALKSALFAGGSTAKFVRMAAEAYQGEVRQQQPCGACGGSMNLANGVVIFEIDTIVGRCSIQVTEVPQYVCTCGETEEDLLVLSALEETLEQEVALWQRKNLPIPEKLTFSSLLDSKPLVSPNAH